MNLVQNVLSDTVVYTKYAKYRPDLKRRETYEEIIDRYIAMLLKKYATEEEYKSFINKKEVKTTEGSLADQIIKNSSYVYQKKVLPSMRALQFAGPAIERNASRLYNCCYLPMDDYNAFSEIMFLLLGGTGVGYSVQKKHVEKLPTIKKPTKERKFLIDDSIQGWSDAVKVLIKAYFGLTDYRPRFDFSDIREKGAPLITSGGKAPGPGPLKICLARMEDILESKNNGDQLKTIEVHDLNCFIADAVLAGGIRRAALIAGFSLDDEDMLTCKFGNWWELNPQRGRANNSAVIVRNRIKKKEFLDIWKKIELSKSGEPGISFTDDSEYFYNPCHEISLRPFSFCNLTELNGAEIKTQEDLDNASRVASFFGTLQAGFTDFHYLRPIWKKNTEKDSLIGVGITGICNGGIIPLDLVKSAGIVKSENERVASLIGINMAARTTTIKPSGTTSCLLNTSSGIHAWFDEFYIRNMQCRVGDDLYNYFSNNHPDLIKVMDYDPHSAVIGIPQKAPKSAILRNSETAIEFLERVKRFNLEWVREGHRSGPNYNNVSATCNMKDDEWEEVGAWLWQNKDVYSGISFLPYDGGTYKDAPFQSCTEYEYNKKASYIRSNPIDLTAIVEAQDNTNLSGEAACVGGACEISY